MAIAEWLNLKFLSWEQSEGRRKTLGEFAEYLGVSRISLSDWINGKYAPKAQNIGKLAERLGLEIYDLVGIPRPLPQQMDSKIIELVNLTAQFPNEIQTAIIGVYQKVIPVLDGKKITDEKQILELLAKMFSQKARPEKRGD